MPTKTKAQQSKEVMTKATTREASEAVKALNKLKVPNTVDVAEAGKRKTKAMEVYERAVALEVTDAASLELAGVFVNKCTAYVKAVDENFNPLETKLRAAKKAATEAVSEFVSFKSTINGPVLEGRAIVDGKIRVYEAAEKKRVDDLNAKAIADAKKKAEDDRKKQIDELKEQGTPEAKDAIKALKEEPVEIKPVFVPEPTKIAGLSHGEAWTSDIDRPDPDKALFALIQAAVKDFDRYGKFLEPNWTRINTEARNEKAKFDVPGYRAYDKGKTSHR